MRAPIYRPGGLTVIRRAIAEYYTELERIYGKNISRCIYPPPRVVMRESLKKEPKVLYKKLAMNATHITELIEKRTFLLASLAQPFIICNFEVSFIVND